MRSRPAQHSLSLAVLLIFAGLGTPAWAVFKVVGPNGQVTYSDRPPAEPAARVQQLSPQATPLPANNLPPALREATARFPVTLYTTTACAACDSARSYLRRRGVPYNENIISTVEDQAVFASRFNTVGNMPVVTVGSQKIEAFSEQTWGSYLDAAGYPKTSMLPVGYTPPVATPLAPRAGDGARNVPNTPQSDAPQRLPDDSSTTPPGFKF